jgi:hypothetical protein
MSTFYAYLTGEGGCDYTIACNRTLRVLKATNKKDAEKEIQEIYPEVEHYGIDIIQLFEVKEVTEISVSKIKKSLAEIRRHAEIKRVEAEERALYEKLHAKYKQ